MRTRIEGVRRAANAMIWAIQPEKLEAIMNFLDLRASGVEIDPETRAQLIAERRSTEPRRAGTVAIIPIYDVIAHRMNMMDAISGGTSTSAIATAFEDALADPGVSHIVFEVDSPGGVVYGTPELARKIYAARGQKPMLAVINAEAFSAAYYIAAAADEVLITPSGLVGSVGVLMKHDDFSVAFANEGWKRTFITSVEYKAEGNMHEPLSKATYEHWLSQVMDYHRMFVGDLSTFRGLSVEEVEEKFGRGRTFTAERALEAGLVDRIASLEEVLAELTGVDDDGPEEPDVEPEDVLVRSSAPGLEVRKLEGEVRAASEDGAERLEGVAVPYDSLSADLGGFREEFAPGAFAEDLEARGDVAVLWQHDPRYVFGRTTSGTARVWEEDGKVKYTAEPPDAQWAKDAMASIRRGDVTKNSFAFRVADPRSENETWERRDGVLVRRVLKAQLYEVGPQTLPAYSETSVVVAPDTKRALAAFLETEAARMQQGGEAVRAEDAPAAPAEPAPPAAPIARDLRRRWLEAQR